MKVNDFISTVVNYIWISMKYCNIIATIIFKYFDFWTSKYLPFWIYYIYQITVLFKIIQFFTIIIKNNKLSKSESPVLIIVSLFLLILKVILEPITSNLWGWISIVLNPIFQLFYNRFYLRIFFHFLNIFNSYIFKFISCYSS